MREDVLHDDDDNDDDDNYKQAECKEKEVGRRREEI